MDPQEQTLVKFKSEYENLIEENGLEHIVCEILIILFLSPIASSRSLECGS